MLRICYPQLKKGFVKRQKHSKKIRIFTILIGLRNNTIIEYKTIRNKIIN